MTTVIYYAFIALVSIVSVYGVFFTRQALHNRKVRKRLSNHPEWMRDHL